jgi:hypothetical protein
LPSPTGRRLRSASTSRTRFGLPRRTRERRSPWAAWRRNGTTPRTQSTTAGRNRNLNLHPAHRLLGRRSQGRPDLFVKDIQGALDLLLADHNHLGVDRGALQLGVARELPDVQWRLSRDLNSVVL